MVCDTRGLSYTVHIPATVLELDMEEDFIHANDSVIVKVSVRSQKVMGDVSWNFPMFRVRWVRKLGREYVRPEISNSLSPINGGVRL